MKFENIKVGGVYFYDWQEFMIITSITKEFVKYKSVHIRLSTGEEGVFIEKGQTATLTFKDRLVDHLKEYEDAKFWHRDFATNIIHFLFKLPKK